MTGKMRSGGAEEQKITETRTYDEETGYYITSVFPVLDEAARREQSVSITEEMTRLMGEHGAGERGNGRDLCETVCGEG